MARVVAPGIPYPVIRRGDRRQTGVFSEEDHSAYLALMAEWCGGSGVEVWAYCLMAKHVHLIAVPGSEEGLRRAIGQAHRRYTRRANFREGWRGHLWEGQFAFYAMDERYGLAAARYIEWNPVRTGVVNRGLPMEQCRCSHGEKRWSSRKGFSLNRVGGRLEGIPFVDSH